MRKIFKPSDIQGLSQREVRVILNTLAIASSLYSEDIHYSVERDEYHVYHINVSLHKSEHFFHLSRWMYECELTIAVHEAHVAAANKLIQ